MESTKKQWIAPSIQRYGSFESMTQSSCTNKDYGGGDGVLFQGQPTVCVSAS